MEPINGRGTNNSNILIINMQQVVYFRSLSTNTLT